MSAAPQATFGARKRPLAPFAPIHHSIIENMRTLTHAELAMVLIVAMQTEQADSAPITEGQWTEYTGLGERMKLHAEKGLEKKGLLASRGRGKAARFALAIDEWRGYLRHAPREKPEAARDTPRPAPKPKPMHPECAEGGCQMARQAAGKAGAPDRLISISSAVATPIPQHVAESPIAGSVAAGLAAQPEPLGGQASSEANDSAGTGWFGATLAGLRSRWATVGTQFLQSLVAVVLAAVPDATDAELAEAVETVYAEKRGAIQGAGFFLATPVLADTVKSNRLRRSAALLTPIAQHVAEPSADELARIDAELARPLFDDVAKVQNECERELRYEARRVVYEDGKKKYPGDLRWIGPAKAEMDVPKHERLKRKLMEVARNRGFELVLRETG